MPVESNDGRGATRNVTPTRFNLKERVEEGDWLDQVEALDGFQAPDDGHYRTSQVDPDSQQLARYWLRPFDQRLSRL